MTTVPEIIYISETNSTNNYLKELLQTQNVDEGTVVWADFQSAGKGQRGNGWESEAGKNILFSIVLFPGFIKAGEQFILSQIVSLAVANCLQEYTEGISIKWPNDIYWNEKKICGILLENTILEDNIGHSVAGIGININQENFRSEAPNPVSLKQITNRDYNLEEILKTVVDNINAYYQQIKIGKTDFLIKQYKESLFRKDGYHLYNDGISDFLARIQDVDSSGLLILKTKEGEERHFAFKEVKYII
ncbi:biotin--[acetyl-CoA-carboxylase] ligase [Dysgonomonas mossii]|uniref:Biotin--[acetyl-CoA-carboxylase] ligase n=1 Tax=Dysgonomonas mossii TaxID=163665 RepID=A0A4Y9IRC2_9BACT|nr:biotin--[acetyl-CoA-carboxylase] ligase [Dysgonomonas mossii]MBF0759927.1 biotin--[acetyl-CoA-carboxylase] ligase [Dysgonomonas mossii]TFU90882.1 biotin--[acetyl-CoA-carboxylase] ligase [Dysgonomonas mossii]